MRTFFTVLGFLYLGFGLEAQKSLPIAENVIKNAQEIWLDDYGNVYLLNTKELNFSKYDSLGNKKGELLWAVPFHVQSVDNPLTLSLFSANSQELRFVDQNLTDIQDPVHFTQNFAHIKAVYVEDLQYIWIVDDVQKKLSKLDYRNRNIIQSYLINEDFNDLKNFIVYENRIYLNKGTNFEVIDLKGNQLYSTGLDGDLLYLNRENKNILLFFSNKVLSYKSSETLNSLFDVPSAKAIGGNYKNWVVIERNKLYLYPRKK